MLLAFALALTLGEVAGLYCAAGAETDPVTALATQLVLVVALHPNVRPDWEA